MERSHPSLSGALSGKTDRVRSLLVIHQGALGDFVLALPLLWNLRDFFPSARRVAMGFPRILQLVDQRFYVDEIVPIDQKGMASFFVRGGRLDWSLCQFFSGFDLLVVFSKDSEGVLVGNLRRISRGPILHIDPFPQWTDRMYITDHLLRELGRYGFSPSQRLPRLFLNQRDQDWGRSFWRERGLTEEERSRALVIHPGSGSKKKVWPLERFLEIAHYFRGQFDSRVLVVIGPAEGQEVQKAFGGREWGSPDEAPLLVKGLSLLELASVMEGCRLFVGNDSGITHMAAAVGLPTVAIFGPSDHKIWSPKGERVVVVRKKVNCSPCSQERFIQCSDIECLRNIGVEDVMEGIRRLNLECRKCCGNMSSEK